MKLTFKQFLEDIDIVDDDAFSHHDSDNTADEYDRVIKGQKRKDPSMTSGNYQRLNAKFPDKGYELFYHEMGDGVHITLVNKKTSDTAIALKLEKQAFTIIGKDKKKKKFTAYQTDLLSATKKYQGKGLAPLVYQAIAESGTYILMSSNEQTQGGAKTWKKLIRNVNPHDVYVLSIVEGYGDDHYAYALVKGRISELETLAYDVYANRFIIIPDGHQITDSAMTVEEENEFMNGKK